MKMSKKKKKSPPHFNIETIIKSNGLLFLTHKKSVTN